MVRLRLYDPSGGGQAQQRKGSPPFLFFHGTADPLVPLSQSQDLDGKLRDAGVASAIIVMEGEGHGWKGELLKKSFEQTVSFFKDQLRNKP